MVRAAGLPTAASAVSRCAARSRRPAGRWAVAPNACCQLASMPPAAGCRAALPADGSRIRSARTRQRTTQQPPARLQSHCPIGSGPSAHLAGSAGGPWPSLAGAAHCCTATAAQGPPAVAAATSCTGTHTASSVDTATLMCLWHTVRAGSFHLQQKEATARPAFWVSSACRPHWGARMRSAGVAS